ncbi:MAG: transposase [Inconstantimicrobium porci]|uniref:transposase n=1 Tax=Inconstantimicrobium porci TaxID=2652291 RepID=UPI002A91942C|nr:transposase [Inconstantimicrobium porci]MDY5912719.1 transposase [Inconstantimicrobium porci]
MKYFIIEGIITNPELMNDETLKEHISYTNKEIEKYMNGLYSSRDIEKACYRDINFMFLLEGSKAVTKNMQKLFTKYVNQQHILWQNVLVFLL